MTEDTNQNHGTIEVDGQEFTYDVVGENPPSKETIGKMITSLMKGTQFPPSDSQKEHSLFVFNGKELSREQAEVVVAIDTAHDLIEGNFADFVETLLDSGFTPVSEFSDEDLVELLNGIEPENFTEEDMELISELEPTQPEEKQSNEKEELKMAKEKLEMIQSEAQNLLETLRSTLDATNEILKNI